MDKMKIEIWSDIACPYCYIGKRTLENALRDFPYAAEIELIWHSYELNPALPKAGIDKTFYQHMAEIHNHGEAEEREHFKKVLKAAQEVGLDYQPEKIIVTNTSDALRMIKLAAKYSLADEAEERLFKAYFIDGLNIGDNEVLLKLGHEIGLLKEELKNLFTGDEYTGDIQQDMEHAENEYQLEYIPFYLLNNKFIIQGSIQQEEYLDTLYKAYADWKQNGTGNGNGQDKSITGQSCSIDGICS